MKIGAYAAPIFCCCHYQWLSMGEVYIETTGIYTVHGHDVSTSSTTNCGFEDRKH